MGCQMVNGNKLNDWSSESSELDRTQQWGYPIPTKEYLLLLLLNHSLLLLLEFTYLYNILSFFHNFNNTPFYIPKIHKGNL